MCVKNGFLYRSLFLPMGLLASGCAMALPSPQVSQSKGVAPIGQVVETASLHHFDSSKDAALHRFLKNGPGTVAVADILHLGRFSTKVQSTTSVGILGQSLMTGGIAAGLNPLGGAMFLLGAGDHPHLMAHMTQLGCRLVQGRHHPVHLREPGVRNQRDFHGQPGALCDGP